MQYGCCMGMGSRPRDGALEPMQLKAHAACKHHIAVALLTLLSHTDLLTLPLKDAVG